MKRRFQNDSKLFEGYIRNMGELLEKGYVRKSEKRANDGGLWYLPRHEIRHPSKLNKVRIVFD